jgi:galactokinase
MCRGAEPTRLSSPGVIATHRRRIRVPGRVNLIGDHTDYTGGLVLPMAIDRWTTLDVDHHDDRILLSSDTETEPVDLRVPVDVEPDSIEPAWGRFVAAVALEVGARHGLTGRVSTDIPVGAGLSSSAALELALALAFGFRGSPLELAQLGQRAEHRATGVPTGIMDQLSIAAATQGHASLIDCSSFEVEPVAIPEGAEVVVTYVAHRTLVGSEYATRVAQCAAAEAVVGPLRLATPADLSLVDDVLIRARARHVITENERVRAMAEALRSGDLVQAGAIMIDGHRSLADDFGTSTPDMDAAVETLCATPGVYGARMTGGGFGGCVVSLCEPSAPVDGWVVRPVGGPIVDDA